MRRRPRPTPHSNDWRPVLYRPCSDADALDALLAGGGIDVFDCIGAELRDLLKSRLPGRRHDAQELDERVAAHLGGASLDDYGVWAFYPWSRRLVHLLDEAEFVELRTDRNRNKITAEEQNRLAGCRVGVVGLSVGLAVAMTIAQERGAGELRLADFDRIDLSNLNRIRAGVHDLGVPKVIVAARAIAELDPFLRVTIFRDGLTDDNMGSFFLDGGKLDVCIDECDSIPMKLKLRYRARAERVPVLMETSDRGLVDVERFDAEPERPVFHGRVEELGPDALRDLSPEQGLALVLRIVDHGAISARARDALAEIGRTRSTWPQLASAVAQGGGVIAAVARRILLGEAVASGRYYVDADSIIGGGEGMSRPQGPPPIAS